jgi:dsDNA-specific endonuclease/ATPase MutS2
MKRKKGAPGAPPPPVSEPGGSGEETVEEVVEHPIEDYLDLHTFNPRDVKDLLDDYFEAAVEKGFGQVRVIHGKGTGALRERVHSILRRHPSVESFELAGERGGSWGATIVRLKQD